MRLCLVGPTYPFRGGIAHYTSILALQLRQHGHEVSLCSFSQGYPRLFYPGRTDRDPSLQPLVVEPKWLLTPSRPWTWVQVAARMAADAPDAVLVEWWLPYWAPLLAVLARRLQQAGVLTFMDCQNVLPHERHPLDQMLTSLALRQAAACLIYSLEHRQQLLSLVPGMPHTLLPFPAYGPLARAAPSQAQAQRQLGLKGPVVLFFGFVRPYKGLHVLLQAMAQVLQSLPVHALIVGEFWQNPCPTRQLINTLQLNAWTTVVDRYIPNEELGLYFAAADVLVMPYLAPVQSGVLALAQAFHKPVIASRVGGLADSLVEGKTGLLVEPGDEYQLAQAILRFFTDDLGAALAPHLQALKPDSGWKLVIKALEDMTSAAGSGMLPGWRRDYRQDADVNGPSTDLYGNG